MKQRSRWIKGYMQTYIVHMRKPELFLKYYGIKGLIGFQFFVGVPCIIFVTLVPMLTISAIAVIHGGLIPNWLLFIVYFNLLAGVALHFCFALKVIQFEGWKWKEMITGALVFPFYWILHAVASVKALWQLFTNPHYWEKTEHGVSKIEAPAKA